ncbi:Target of EGR1, member 1 (Nuclear) [Kappamyces sp. JEL0829]|nr:Target of EGR1, member 1 (Nuclear) [Kappamyces sp. JEL0829]
MSYTIVNRHNLATLAPAIRAAIQNSEFVSIDTEFTGLGDAKKTRTQNIEDRYVALRELATSHSIVALGLSLFSRSEKTSQDWTVRNFHFSLLCLQDHVVSPSSLSFLVEHGFDFNDQFRNGIPFMPGGDIVMEHDNHLQCNTLLRSLFLAVLARKAPVILHNGFLDLMFIYQSFYAALPPTLPVFIADCHEMFAGGIYDTKYISDFVTREKASFLALLFRK